MNENLFSNFRQFNKLQNYLIFTLLLLISFANTFAQKEIVNGIPNVISFQGTISDTEGDISITDEYTITFNIYSEKVGGTPIWSETQNEVQLVDGKFQVLFGADKVSNQLNILLQTQHQHLKHCYNSLPNTIR